MRMHYELSHETRSVLADNVQAIAREMDVCDNALHQILAENVTDCFAKFKRLYSAAVRAGVDVSPWDAWMAETRARYGAGQALTSLVKQKLKEEASTNGVLFDAVADGHIDEHERKPVLRAVAVERRTLDMLEASVVSGEIRDFAKAAASRNGEKK